MDRRGTERDRRSQSFNSLVRGNLRPRRRANRRSQDNQLFMVDIYDTGLVMVSLAIVLMSCLDAFFTLELMSLGANEVNYFMKVLIESDISAFLLTKFAITCTGVVFLTSMAHYRLGGVLQVRRILEGLCAIYSCLIVWELFLLAVVATSPAH